MFNLNRKNSNLCHIKFPIFAENSILMSDLSHFPIILFDGNCNLCNRSVQFVLKNERNNELRFASLQSEMGQNMLQKHGLPLHYTESVLFVKDEKLFQKSTAALKICSHLKWHFRLLQVFWLLPRFLRDALYGFVAKNRLKWFGTTESCWIMEKEWRERFVD